MTLIGKMKTKESNKINKELSAVLELCCTKEKQSLAKETRGTTRK